MDRADIASLEDAARAAMVWIPEGHDGVSRPSALLIAVLPAAAIVAVAAALLLVLL